MARCANCGAEADPNVRFCPECGKKFVAVAPSVSAGEDGLYYCFRHKKTPTRVTCGRCEKPICDRCMVIGPAGIRCRECARNRVPLRWGGLFHDLTGSFGSFFRPFGANPWIFYIVVMIAIRVLFGCFRG